MATSSTIKEFLISLGADINQSSVRQFFATIEGMTKAVAKFSFALEATASGLKAALIATASSLENLFYIAQRAGTTVDTLKELQYGMRQIGLSAEDANQALESLAMAMRLNPGNESLLRYLGVATRDAAGSMRDTTQITTDFVARLSRMPFFIAAQYAQMFGINARTLYQLLQNFGALQAQQRAWRALAGELGVNLQDSATKSKDFMQSLRGIIEVIDLLWIKVSTVLIERLRPQLDDLRRFLIAHAKDISDFGINVGKAVLDASDALLKLLPQIDKLVTATVGWKVALEAIADVIIYRIFGPIGLLLALAMQFKGLFGPVTPEERAEAERQRKSGQPAVPGRNYWEEFQDWAHRAIPGFKGFGPDPNYPGVQPQGGAKPGAQPQSSPGTVDTSDAIIPVSGRIPIGVRQNNPGNLRDWATAAGHGGGFAIFRSAFEGLVAMRDNLMSYARRGLDTVAGIINRWAPPSENNTASYIGSIARMMGVDPNAHLNMQDPNVLSGLMQGISRIENGYNAYGRDMFDRAARFGTGNAVSSRGDVKIDNKTDIHVHGGEPQSTANEVKHKQDMVNAALVRQFRTAVLA